MCCYKKEKKDLFQSYYKTNVCKFKTWNWMGIRLFMVWPEVTCIFSWCKIFSSWQHSEYCRPNIYGKGICLLLGINNILQIKTCNSFNSNTFGWGPGINYVNLKSNFDSFQEILIENFGKFHKIHPSSHHSFIVNK